jgi:hypothetical protein
MVNDTAYIVSHGDASSLHMVDIATPTRPRGIDSYEANEQIFDLAVTGNFAYLAGGSDGLFVVEVP